MPVVAIRKTAWEAGNESQRWAMRLAGERVELGQPAVYRQGNGTEHYIFCDQGITVRDIAILGTVAAGLAQYPNWTVPTDSRGRVDRVAGRAAIKEFVQSNIVLPRDIAYTEVVQVSVPDRVQVEVLDENGDPFDPPVFRWVDDPNGGTHLVDVEQSLGDPYDLTLAAQGAPGWIGAGESIPGGLSPVEVTS